MRCSDVEALWDASRDGSETPSESVLAHLRGCRTCQASYEANEGIAYCLTCLPLAEPPATLVPRILAHIAMLGRKYGSPTSDGFTLLDSPLGRLAVAWRASGITFVGIQRGESAEETSREVERRLRRPMQIVDPPSWVLAAVADFFSSWRVDMSRVDISGLSTFEQAALRKAAEIPPGEVRSYGWIAREIGHPYAARAVGQAMARNPVALFFPCHRVVDASGALHNYLYGVEVKAQILQMEGYRKA